jgi:hypothetical protein
MRVLDAAGKAIGKVSFVKMGDPQAITAAGQAVDGDEPHVSRELAEHLLRIGYVKVDRKGLCLFSRDVYVAADQLDRVEGGIVHLSVPADALLTET